MRQQNKNNNRGRTFWDLIVEHPKMTLFTIILLIVGLFFLSWNKYSIKSPLLSFEPEKTTNSKTNNNLITSKQNIFDTSNSSNKRIIIYPKTNTVKKQFAKLPTLDTIKTNIINVTSHNQTGGITANQVNIGSVPRKLDYNIQNQLLNILNNRNEKIEVRSILGDSESYTYANQIFDFLKSKGFSKVDGVTQVVYSKPVVGQFIDRDSIGVKISIGSKQNQ